MTTLPFHCHFLYTNMGLASNSWGQVWSAICVINTFLLLQLAIDFMEPLKHLQQIAKYKLEVSTFMKHWGVNIFLFGVIFLEVAKFSRAEA